MEKVDSGSVHDCCLGSVLSPKHFRDGIGSKLTEEFLMTILKDCLKSIRDKVVVEVLHVNVWSQSQHISDRDLLDLLQHAQNALVLA